MLGRTGREEPAHTFDAISKGHAAASQLVDPTLDLDSVPVTGWRSIGKLDTRDQQKKALFFDFSVMETGLEAKSSPGDLEPDEIVRVMNDSHLIRFRVADLNRHGGTSFGRGWNHVALGCYRGAEIPASGINFKVRRAARPQS